MISGFCQIAITPSNANACNCSGFITFTSPTGNPVSYVLYDYSNISVASGNSASGNFILSGLCPEVYTLELTESGNITNSIFNIPTSGLNPGNAVTAAICSTSPTVNLNNLIPGIAPGGVWTNPLQQTISNSLPANTLMDGWYLYSIPSNGCSVITGVMMDFIQNANPGQSTTYLICENYLPFQMVDFLAGSPNPNGQWFNSQGLPMNGTFNPATMNSELFTYMVNNVPGCGPVFSTLFVSENQPPNAGTNATINVCQNGTPFNMLNYLGGTPGTGGQWFGPTNAPVSATFNPAVNAPGVYRYNINGLTPCVDANAYLTINFISPSPSGLPATVTTCVTGNSINMLNALNGNPLPGGTWTNSTGATVGGTFNPQTGTSGNYFYYYPNVGCPEQVQLTIVLESLPNAGNDNSVTICRNVTSVNLNGLISQGTSTGGTWLNASGVTVPSTFIPPATGNTFTFTYSVNGVVCPADNSLITINIENPPVAPPSITLSVCSEDAAINLAGLYPQFPNIAFENSNGTPAGSLFDPSGGNNANFVAVQSSLNSCPDGEGTVAIVVVQPLFPISYLDMELCASLVNFNLESLDPDANVAGGVWTDDSGNVIAPLVDLNFSGIQHYTFTANNGNECGSNSLDVDIESFAVVSAGPDNASVFCYSDEAVPLTQLLPASASSNGTWTFNNQSFDATVLDPAIHTTGSYIYSLEANGPCPADIAILNIVVQQGIDYEAGANIEVCAGSSAIQIGQAPLPNTSYSWTPAINLSNANSSFPIVTIPTAVVADVTTNYQVLVTDGVCQIVDDLQVLVHPLPIVNIGDLYEICEGESVSVSSNAPGVYSWSPSFLFDNSNAQSQTFIPQQDVTIALTITDNFGCASSDDALVSIHPNPVIVFNPEALASCSPLEVFYAIDSASQHVDLLTWTIPNIGNFYGNSFSSTLHTPGQYDLILNAGTSFGCTSSLEFFSLMEVYDSPIANFRSVPDEITTLNPIARFRNMSIGAIVYQWDFNGLGTSNAFEPTFEFPNTQPANFTICLKIINEFGCADSTCEVLHLDNEYVFYAPNAITPNQDGTNDFFSPKMLGFDESTYSLEIFDRWGNLVFFTKEYGTPWSGNVRGGEYYVQDDVYIWQVQVKDKELADYQTFRGTLTVIR